MDQMVTGLDGLLGVRLDEASADRVQLRVPVTPALHQMFGIVHGGVYCALVESAASLGGARWLGADGRVVGVSNQTDFLKAVSDGELIVVSTPVHRGFSQQLWEVKITDSDGQLIARGQVRLQNLRPGGGRPH
ncbi:PaaI family thioesterase [Micromonospora sp. NBC_01813]|uniref:PaaI family thioesterase n=1 Tax=Micromonospora sp. NBC_01813 TaxID=2975988 RepID=UPI002DD8A100|nr:PaaI family thioesterase [Micromonospora sp. NBC_01813]WSA11119.1 PaaI family thioesterase [Micromonospora sp. NBC_01813]